MNHLYKEEQLFWAPPANYSASARWNFYMTRFLNLNATIFGNPYFVEQHPGPKWPPNDLQMQKLFHLRQSFSSFWQCITIELSSTIALQHNNATDMVWLPYSVPKQTSFTSCCPRPHNKITHYFLTIFTGETDICPIKLSLVKTLFQKNKNSVDFERRIEHFKMTK